MAKTIKALKAKGVATRTESRDRTRMVRSRARDIGANLRRRSGEAKDEVRAINAEMVAIAVTAASEARRVTANARRTLRQLGHAAPRRLTALVDDLELTASRVEQIAAHTRQRVDGITPDVATRLVSLHDPDARPIRKGRLGKPVEFGYKAQVVDNEDGIVVDHNVEMGNPPDAPMLVPAIERVAVRARTVPAAVTADRGYGETSIEDALTALGVATVVLPTKGKPSASRRAIEQRPGFQRLVKWRTGSEGRISCLKRDFGWNRTQLDGVPWCADLVRSRGVQPQPDQDRRPGGRRIRESASQNMQLPPKSS
jgi:IS5 family transposase